MSRETSNRRRRKPVKFNAKRFYGLRIGRLYFKFRDTDLHPLLFSERNGYGYVRLLRVGVWEFGVRTK